MKDWRQEEKGMTEDEMVGWHHWLNGPEFEQALGEGEGQGSLECCSPWGCKELDTTWWLNNNNIKKYLHDLENILNKVSWIWNRSTNHTRKDWNLWPHCFGHTAQHSGILAAMIRDWTCAPCSASAESYPLDHQRSPLTTFKLGTFCLL